MQKSTPSECTTHAQLVRLQYRNTEDVSSIYCLRTRKYTALSAFRKIKVVQQTCMICFRGEDKRVPKKKRKYKCIENVICYRRRPSIELQYSSGGLAIRVSQERRKREREQG